MENIFKAGQLWVVFDSDVYLKVVDVKDNKVIYRRIGDDIRREKSYDDFISYAVNASDVVGEYEHKLRNNRVIDVMFDSSNDFLIRSDSKLFKMDIGELYEHWNKRK